METMEKKNFVIASYLRLYVVKEKVADPEGK